MRTSGESDGLTKSEAEAELRKRIAIDKPTRPLGARMTVTGLAAEYVEVAKRRGRKLATTQNVDSEARNHLEPFFGEKPIDAIRRQDVREFVTVLEKKGLKPKTVANIVRTLSALFRFAMHPDRQWATANPCAGIELPAITDSEEIRFLTVDEVRQLVAQVPESQAVERALYLTAAMTGLRLGELLALRWLDVDFAAARVRVRQNYVRGEFGTPKSRRSTRSVPMADELAAELKRLFDASKPHEDDDLVFAPDGVIVDKSNVARRMKVTLKAAGLPERRFHDLRHTFGTQMAAAGVPLRTLQEWMGHKDLATTQIYADYAPSAHEADLIGRAFATK